MRQHRHGTVQNAVSEAIDATGRKHKDVATFLGIRGSTLSYGMEETEDRPGGLGVNYLHRLAMEYPAAAAPIAQHFAAMAGGVYQPINVENDVISLYAHCGDVAKECGEAQAATIRAAESATAKSDMDAAREIDEAVAALLRAKAAIIARGAA